MKNTTAFILIYLSASIPVFSQTLVFERTLDARSASYIVEIPGQRYIIAGNQNGAGGYLLCLDSKGDSLWQTNLARRIGAVLRTDDKGFILTGTDSSDFLYAVKTDSVGVVIWEKGYSAITWHVNSIAAMPDGKYMLAGSDSHASIAKLAQDGDLIWQKTIFDGEFNDIKVNAEGNISVAGTNASGGHNNLTLLKFDTAGNVLAQYYPNTVNTSMGTSLDLLPDGGYLLGAFSWYTLSSTSHESPRLFKLDSNLIQQSFPTYLEGGEGWVYAVSTVFAMDSGYLAGGHLESSGGVLWIKTQKIDTILKTKTGVIEKTLAGSDGAFIGMGQIASKNGYVVKYDGIPAQVNEMHDVNVTLYPNPFSGYSILKFSEIPLKDTRITLYDLHGRLLREQQVTEKTVRIDRKGLAAGIYILRLSNETGNRFIRMIAQ